MEQVLADKVKDLMIQVTAEKTGVDQKLVEKIATFQYKEAFAKFREVTEVELVGLGTFVFSSRKARRKIINLGAKIMGVKAKYDKEKKKSHTTEKRKQFVDSFTVHTQQSIDYLTERIERDIVIKKERLERAEVFKKKRIPNEGKS